MDQWGKYTHTLLENHTTDVHDYAHRLCAVEATTIHYQ